MVLKAMKFVHFWVSEVKFKLNRLVSIHITLIQCNGLKGNEKFFENKNCQEKTYFVKKIL